MKKTISILILLLCAFVSLYADDIGFLTGKVSEVANELNLTLEITSGKRGWDKQINAMNKQSEATLRQWYGDTTAKAFMDYKNGKITEKTSLRFR